MDILQAIDIRISRRNYLDSKIDVQKLQEIYDLIQVYNKEGELSIKIIEDAGEAINGFRKSYGMFSGVRTIILFSGNKDDKKLEEKIGYYGEKIVLRATALGLGTCWVGASFDKNNEIFNIEEDKKLVCVVTIGNVEDKFKLKEKFIYKMMHRGKKPMEDFYESNEKVPDWFIRGIKAVMKAPSALNKQPVYFRYENGKVSAYVRESKTYNEVDLGIAKCHFEIASGYKFQDIG